MPNRAAIELGSALIVAAVSVGALVEASGYRGASAYMPLAVTAFATALALVWAGQSALALARGSGGRFEISAQAVARFVVIVAAVVAYVFGITYAGFFTATVLMVPALAFAIGYRDVVTTALATIGFCLVLYGVFRLLLSIPLPPEAILQIPGA